MLLSLQDACVQEAANGDNGADAAVIGIPQTIAIQYPGHPLQRFCQARLMVGGAVLCADDQRFWHYLVLGRDFETREISFVNMLEKGQLCLRKVKYASDTIPSQPTSSCHLVPTLKRR